MQDPYNENACLFNLKRARKLGLLIWRLTNWNFETTMPSKVVGTWRRSKSSIFCTVYGLLSFVCFCGAWIESRVGNGILSLGGIDKEQVWKVSGLSDSVKIVVNKSNSDCLPIV
jgi:hypothetical protein